MKYIFQAKIRKIQTLIFNQVRIDYFKQPQNYIVIGIG
ncbi:hypothetical protein NBRC111893_1123 [Lentilactobacillus kosonis]|uniref:Uncharacterized protein n=1 Tax=Lentilactobacillus kosonis TaxID=2810561 RepID=A0A401FKW4_9LACO|nr:hypothetical protein NBRC111893_1123 [Lentilactobacillus kosonis]